MQQLHRSWASTQHVETRRSSRRPYDWSEIQLACVIRFIARIEWRREAPLADAPFSRKASEHSALGPSRTVRRQFELTSPFDSVHKSDGLFGGRSTTMPALARCQAR